MLEQLTLSPFLVSLSLSSLLFFLTSMALPCSLPSPASTPWVTSSYFYFFPTLPIISSSFIHSLSSIFFSFPVSHPLFSPVSFFLTFVLSPRCFSLPRFTFQLFTPFLLFIFLAALASRLSPASTCHFTPAYRSLLKAIILSFHHTELTFLLAVTENLSFHTLFPFLFKCSSPFSPLSCLLSPYSSHFTPVLHPLSRSYLLFFYHWAAFLHLTPHFFFFYPFCILFHFLIYFFFFITKLPFSPSVTFTFNGLTSHLFWLCVTLAYVCLPARPLTPACSPVLMCLRCSSNIGHPAPACFHCLFLSHVSFFSLFLLLSHRAALCFSHSQSPLISLPKFHYLLHASLLAFLCLCFPSHFICVLFFLQLVSSLSGGGGGGRGSKQRQAG